MARENNHEIPVNHDLIMLLNLSPYLHRMMPGLCSSSNSINKHICFPLVCNLIYCFKKYDVFLPVNYGLLMTLDFLPNVYVPIYACIYIYINHSLSLTCVSYFT